MKTIDRRTPHILGKLGSPHFWGSLQICPSRPTVAAEAPRSGMTTRGRVSELAWANTPKLASVSHKGQDSQAFPTS